MKSKVSKKKLVELAKQGDQDAEIQLLEMNQLGILAEAKNPDTSEEIAIEMLAELSISPIDNVRQKAIALLLKLVPEKITEKLLEQDVSFDSKENILRTLLDSSSIDVFLLLSLYEAEDFPEELKNQIIEKINGIRKSVEKNAVEIMKIQNQADELEELKLEKFKIINDLYHSVGRLDQMNVKNKIFHDFKLDVELSYQSLKSNIKLD